MFFMLIALMVMMVIMMRDYYDDGFLYDEWSWMVLFMPYHDRYENLRVVMSKDYTVM